MVLQDLGLKDFLLPLVSLRVSPTISLQVDAFSAIEADAFRLEQMPLNQAAVAVNPWTDPTLAVDHPLPWDIAAGRQGRHGKTDRARRAAGQSAYSTVCGNVAVWHLVDQGVDTIIQQSSFCALI
jgi:hypothetical protein